MHIGNSIMFCLVSIMINLISIYKRDNIKYEKEKARFRD